MTDPEVVFVVRKSHRWQDVLDGGLPTVSEVRDRMVDNEACWIVQTYLQLARHGLPVRLADRIPPQAVAVVDGITLGALDGPWGAFLLACRSDGHRPILAQAALEQNPCHGRAWVHHWPQPGLLPRDPQRGARIERLVFMGAVCNLDPGFRSETFHRALARRGVELIVKGKPTDDTPPQWHDYRTCDLVLAVRSAPAAHLANKPASKLVNAWLAGAPALLGPEPAYRALRQDRDDYLEVHDPADVLAAIDVLQANPGRYAALRARCAIRAPAFTVDALVAQWRQILFARAVPQARAWYRRPLQLRWAMRGARCLGHRMVKIQHKRMLAAWARRQDD